MRFFAVKLLPIVVVALCLVPSGSQGAEGRRPIYQPIVIGPGDEGKYVVTRDIAAASPIIQVLAGTGTVDIDLNGFSLVSSNAGTIQVNSVISFKIRNGEVRGGGISINSAQRTIVEDLTVSPGVDVGLLVQNVAKFAIRRNIIRGGEPAMLIDTATSGVIEDNIMDGGIAAMVLRDLENVDVARNRVDNPGSADGIDVDGCSGCRFAGNLVRNALDDGMDLDRVIGSRISGNVITGGASGGNGIHITSLSHYNLVFENTVSDSGGVGILVEGVGNVIDSNLISGNASWGLHLIGTDNAYKGNVANNNGGTVVGCPGTGPATTDLCDATSGGNQSPLNQPPTLFGDNLMPDPR